MLAIYDLVNAVRKRGHEDLQLMPHCVALVNVSTNYDYTSISHFLKRMKRQVLCTNSSSLLLPGMSLGQVKLAWRERIKQMGVANNPTIHDIDDSVEFKTLIAWTKCPKLDQAAKERIYFACK